MIGSNGTGPRPAPVNRQRDFEVFDRLPAEVRRAMNYAWFGRSAAIVETQMQRIGAEKLVKLMPLADQRAVEEERMPKPKRPAFADWTP